MSKVREFPFGNGLVEIQMEKRAKKWWRRNKDGMLLERPGAVETGEGSACATVCRRDDRGRDHGVNRGSEMRTGMIEVTVKRKAKKYRDGILLGSVMAPPFIGLLFLDAFGRHPGAGLAYILGMITWDIFFAIANKKPRRAGRGRETGTRVCTQLPRLFYHG